MRIGILLAFSLLTTGTWALAAARSDLNPVAVHRPPNHEPVVLVADGEAAASIVVAVAKERMTHDLRQAVRDLQHFVERATGAKLPVVHAGAADGAAIVLGDTPAAAEMGLDSAKLPVEGFAIRTAPSRVHIVGWRPEEPRRAGGDGLAWGVYEFLERFVDVRFYFPGEIGCDVPARKTLAVPPASLRDAPHFRKRQIWPSGGRSVTKWTGIHHRRMRSGDTWPVKLQVHSPTGWPKLWGESRPECFQLRSDGTRNLAMLCYGHPRTLETYIEAIEAWYERGKNLGWGRKTPIGNNITVSPNDMGIACHCEHCRKLWWPDGGRYGTASKILADFVQRLAVAVRKRWPDKTIIYLPYSNYTICPPGTKFPDNVEVQLCGMPGLATYKEPAVRKAEQANIDAWVAATGRRIQNWHYSCWPEDKTKACYLFPNIVARHYRDNRDKTVGSFINGMRDHWDRQHVSLYAWMKCLWNPDFDVEFATEELIRRMFGPAAGTMRELVHMQIDGWEDSRWPTPEISPVAVYEHSYPREDVEKMEALLARAFEQAGGDELVTRRLEYYAGPMRAFFEQSKQFAEGGGRTVLIAQKVAESPAIDGKLDDAAWKEAAPVTFVRATDRERPECTFPTQLRAVWTPDGVTFGFRMAEPKPEALKREIRSRDASMAWWDDNVELFLDVAGKREGYYQLIVNANGAVYDGKGRDNTWTCEGLRAKAHLGKGFWSLEVYVPISAFPDARRPGTGVVWYGNFTRHRVADKNPREYQRLNTTHAPGSHNMMAFGPIQFVE